MHVLFIGCETNAYLGKVALMKSTFSNSEIKKTNKKHKKKSFDSNDSNNISGSYHLFNNSFHQYK